MVGFAATERVPVRLLRLWRAQRLELVVSEAILTELDNTLAAPSFRRRLTAEQITAAPLLLLNEATYVPLIEHVSGAATHPEDDLVLGAAVSAQVDYLVTGDRQLQRLHAYQGIRIVSPRQFLLLLEPDGAPVDG